MKRSFKSIATLIGAVAMICTVQTVRASDSPTSPGGDREAHYSFRDVISDLQNGDLNTPTHKAINQIVSESADLLNEHGFSDDASRVKDEWNKTLQLSYSIEDIGDHRPLIKYLTDLYKTMKDRLGALPNMEIIEDINTLNYAIMVVFQPGGDKKTGEKWTSLEYRKQFIPFTQIVVYWSAFGACTYFTKKYADFKEFKKLCKPVSQKLRAFVGRKITPQLSDYIWGKFNKKTGLMLRPDFSYEIESVMSGNF